MVMDGVVHNKHGNAARHDLLEARAECKTALAVREQLEERLRGMTTRSSVQGPWSSCPAPISRLGKRKDAPKD